MVAQQFLVLFVKVRVLVELPLLFSGMRSQSFLRSLLILGRVSNLPTVWTNVFVGWFVAGGSWTTELVWLIAGVSLIYIAGMTLNDLFDAKWDAEHAPERPIASGNMSCRTARIVCLVELIGGIALLLWKTSFHPGLVALLIVAIVLYNWIHKRWAGSVIIMGICRALVYLGAASAVAVHTSKIEIPSMVLIVAVAMIVYIAGLTQAARSERSSDESKSGVNPGVRLMLVLPVLFPLLAARQIPPDVFRYALVTVGVVAVWAWISIFRSALREKIPKGIAFGIAGIALYDASIVVFSDWQAALVCVFAFLLTLVAQRYIPAT